LAAFVARSYLHEARSARGRLLQLSMTPFFLAHLTVCVGVGLLIGGVAGIGTHDLGSQLGRGFAGGVALGICAALIGLATVAGVDRVRGRTRS
jgi:hypothetical protein